jgi:hypothetical protein
MLVQLFFELIFFTLILDFAPVGIAAEQSCFDFATRVVYPLKERAFIPLPPRSGNGEPGNIAIRSGKMPSGIGWGAVRGEVKKSLNDLIKNLREHESTKSPRVSKMEITPIEDPKYLLRQNVAFEVDPFPLMSVKWTEVWVFSLLQGEPEDPQMVLVSYQKSEGTSYIRHLCGNYQLEKRSPDVTDVYIYEEADATSRSEQDTVNDIRRTLEAFRADPQSK